jgi:hypothetical protein
MRSNGLSASVIKHVGRNGWNVIKPSINAVWAVDMLSKVVLLDADPLIGVPMNSGNMDHNF